jgi:2-isopropylmalate synthase
VADVEFSAEDATRSDRIFLRQCVEAAVTAGATRVDIADTVGCALPEEFAARIADIRRFAGDGVRVAAHCHDDLGMATANTVAAVRAGADEVHVTVNGIGERAGNAAVEEVAAALTFKGIADPGVDMRRMHGLSRLVENVTGVQVQPHKAVVGDHAFAHSSGIHQDGILKSAACYAFVDPEQVGQAAHRFVLTARSGRSAVLHEARRAGFTVPPERVDAVYAAFIEAADRAGGAVPEAAFRKAVARAIAGAPAPAG